MNIILNYFPSRTSKLVLFFCGLLLVLILTQWSLIKTDPLLIYDDELVVAPMGKIVGFNDYLTKLDNAQIVDRQPVRDLSFWLDYQFEKQFSYSIHHLQNVLIWFSISIIFFFILVHEKISHQLSAAAVSLYLFHPGLIISVSWVSARKHLLSELFILLATLFYFKLLKKLSNKYIILITLFYFLSCFSQPINILWPIWVIFHYCLVNWDQNKKIKFQSWFIKLLILLIGVLIITALVNNHYYSVVYTQHTAGVSKYANADENTIALKILSIGASFFQAILPIWPSPVAYYQGAQRNIIGLGLLILFIFAIYKLSKNESKNLLFSWGFFGILPLVVVNLKATNIFGSDTYLLIPVVGIYFLVILGIKFKAWTKYFIGIVLVFFVYNSYKVALAFQSRKDLFLMAQENNESPFVVQNLSDIYFREKQYSVSFQHAVRLLEWGYYNTTMFDTLYANSLYSLTGISIDDKIDWMLKGVKARPNSSWMKYVLARLYEKKENWEKAYQIFRNIAPPEFKELSSDISAITADFYFTCQKNKDAEQTCLRIKATLQDMYKEKWNSMEFDQRVRELNNGNI